jgi:hypothetical protein
LLRCGGPGRGWGDSDIYNSEYNSQKYVGGPKPIYQISIDLRFGFSPDPLRYELVLTSTTVNATVRNMSVDQSH